MGDPILILHGWGSTMNGAKYSRIKAILEKKGFVVFTPDLPGFGENSLKKEAFSFNDYISFVKEFVEKNKLKKVILLGHSFGGRIAIAFTAKYPQLVSKLILVSASGIPHKLSTKKSIMKFVVGKTKRLFTLPVIHYFYQPLRKALYKSIGEMDYYKARNLAETFRNVYQISIVEDLKKITKPTLIVWGENDTFTPLADGLLMHNSIKNSKLIIVKNEGHKLPYENPDAFAKEVLAFIT